MSRRWFSLGAILTAVASLFPAAARAADHTKDPLATVKKNVEEKKAVLVDVREKPEWDEGHVDGAILLPLSNLKGENAAEAAKQLPKDKIVYTHCAAGKRSLAAATILEKLGYKVRPLKPGYDDLLEAGFKEAKEQK